MFHEDYPPQRIVFDGLDTANSFAVDAVPFAEERQGRVSGVVSTVGVLLLLGLVWRVLWVVGASVCASYQCTRGGLEVGWLA